MATHSVHFINWPDLGKGAKIYRARQNDAGWCELRAISNDTYAKVAAVADKDIRNRKLYDAVAKEVFFADTTVFVEGQEDVHLINAYVESVGGQKLPLFGYGSGGASHIQNWVRLARELGIKAVAVFDGDASAEAERCQQEFAADEGVLVRSLPTDDIRDKSKRDGSCTENGKCKETEEIAKEGIFDREWKMKAEHKDEFDRMIEEIREHLA